MYMMGNLSSGKFDWSDVEQNHSKELWILQTSDLLMSNYWIIIYTRYFTEAAQAAHDVADILRQQGGLLVGFEGAWHKFGQ